MNAGSILDDLLERHRGFAPVPEHRTPAKVHRRHGSTSSALPPSKILEAVERGVNPLMLGVQSHRAESAAREKAKTRRKASELGTSRRPQEQVARSGAESPSPRQITHQAGSSSAVAETVLKTHAKLSGVPTAREMQRAREVAVSATLASRYQALRAKGQEEEDERKRSRSGTASVRHSVAEGADSEGEKATHKRVRMEEKSLPPQASPLHMTTPTKVSRTWRDIWRRRCTTRKILRLSRGVSRASALRRYWYTTLSGDKTGITDCRSFSPVMHAARVEDNSGTGKNEEEPATAARASTATLQKLERSSSPFSVLALNDTTGRRCALRRLRGARRTIKDMYGSTQMFGKRSGDVKGVNAVGVAPEALQLPAETAQSAADRTVSSRTSRRQRKEAIRCILSSSEASMWTLAARIVAERLDTISQLRVECMAAAALASRTKRAGVLPLSLARLFPLFGALVEVQELELSTAPIRARSSRNTRRARFALSGGRQSARGAPEIRVLQQRKGVVIEEYSGTLGVLLLPSQSEADAQAWADEIAWVLAQGQDALSCARGGHKAEPLPRVKSMPSIARVPKHFPGASGSFAELLQRLLLRTPTTPSSSHGARERTVATSTATRTPATPLAGLRVLVAVFCGEVFTAAEGCDADARQAHCDEESPRVPTEGVKGGTYPLHRLLHRCL
ncbi:hypothetical protein, conserved [Leishmania tarentolae]|uniref:Uncharacterized protein n=1 Tax=Leishmania tarentolae TaxID=5689 RepID=A0A640KQ91_LEITA|nr:hypothetical protein, conserved [Leishmania tarentolae]